MCIQISDKYAVIGNPVAQSKSPLLHTAFARQTEQKMTYSPLFCELGCFIQTVKQFQQEAGRGLNVTMPFKLEAFELADELTARAQLAQAVNTLVFCHDGHIQGDNTDGVGLVRDITHNLNYTLSGKRVLILGAGGAVRGALLALLAQEPAELFIANRTASKAQALAAAFCELKQKTRLHGGGFDDIKGCFDVVINGSASSMSHEAPPLPQNVWHPDSLVYDMAYQNKPSPFMLNAHDAGVVQCVDGLGMLVEQGAESFALWRGVRPDTHCVLQMLRDVQKQF